MLATTCTYILYSFIWYFPCSTKCFSLFFFRHFQWNICLCVIISWHICLVICKFFSEQDLCWSKSSDDNCENHHHRHHHHHLMSPKSSNISLHTDNTKKEWNSVINTSTTTHTHTRKHGAMEQTNMQKKSSIHEWKCECSIILSFRSRRYVLIHFVCERCSSLAIFYVQSLVKCKTFTYIFFYECVCVCVCVEPYVCTHMLIAL